MNWLCKSLGSPAWVLVSVAVAVAQDSTRLPTTEPVYATSIVTSPVAITPPPLESLAPVATSPSSGEPVVGLLCPCDPSESVYRGSAWKLSAEIIPTQSHLSRGQFGSWPDDGSIAARFVLGYENVAGYGIRARLWGFGQDARTPVDEITLSAGTFSLDFYKRLYLEDTELVLGAGPTSSAIQFELSNNTESEFRGSGLSVFAEVWHPLVRFAKADIGAIGRGRMALLAGEWDDSTGTLIPETEHDNMTVLEAAWGLELRRRFGPLQDKYWFVGILAEHQAWSSDWMGHFMLTSAGFSGTNLNLGLSW